MSGVTNPQILECRRVVVEHNEDTWFGTLKGILGRHDTTTVDVCMAEEKDVWACNYTEPKDLVCVSREDKFSAESVEAAVKKSAEKFCDHGNCSHVGVFYIEPLRSFRAWGYLGTRTPGEVGSSKREISPPSKPTPDMALGAWCKAAIELASGLFFDDEYVLDRRSISDDVCPGIEAASRPAPRPVHCVDGKCVDKNGDPI